MNSDFAKLLSNCQSRINEESVKVIQISNGAIVNPPSGTSGKGSNDVRPEIQGIIDQKMRESGNVSSKDPQEKAQILFSLKDFLDNTSKEGKSTASPLPILEEEEDNGISDEDENDDNEELDENDPSVKDKSFKSSSSYKEDSDIEEVSIDDDDEDPLATKQKPSEEDLDTEISKLDNLQRKINDNISHPNPRPSETVLLKMGSSRPSILPSSQTQTTTSREEEKRQTPNEIPVPVKKAGGVKLNDTITLDDIQEDDKTEPQINSKASSSEPAASKEDSKKDEKEKPKVDVSTKPVEKTKSSSLSEGMFKNISISIVGSGKRNVNIQNLFNSKTSQSTAPAPPTAANPSSSAQASSSSNSASASHSSKTAPAAAGAAGAANTFNAGPNISLKRQGSPSKPFDTKRFKNSSIVITSSRKDAPTITLDELVNNKEEEDEPPKENRAKEFNNCQCGDPLAYMCHDCTYRRWKVGYDFVKTRKPKPVVVEEKITEVPRDTADEKSNSGSSQPSDKAAEILKNVNWSQVFSFAGISVGQA